MGDEKVSGTSKFPDFKGVQKAAEEAAKEVKEHVVSKASTAAGKIDKVVKSVFTKTGEVRQQIADMQMTSKAKIFARGVFNDVRMQAGRFVDMIKSVKTSLFSPPSVVVTTNRDSTGVTEFTGVVKQSELKTTIKEQVTEQKIEKNLDLPKAEKLLNELLQTEKAFLDDAVGLLTILTDPENKKAMNDLQNILIKTGKEDNIDQYSKLVGTNVYKKLVESGEKKYVDDLFSLVKNGIEISNDFKNQLQETSKEKDVIKREQETAKIIEKSFPKMAETYVKIVQKDATFTKFSSSVYGDDEIQNEFNKIKEDAPVFNNKFLGQTLGITQIFTQRLPRLELLQRDLEKAIPREEEKSTSLKLKPILLSFNKESVKKDKQDLQIQIKKFWELNKKFKNTDYEEDYNKQYKLAGEIIELLRDNYKTLDIAQNIGDYKEFLNVALKERRKEGNKLLERFDELSASEQKDLSAIYADINAFRILLIPKRKGESIPEDTRITKKPKKYADFLKKAEEALSIKSPQT